MSSSIDFLQHVILNVFVNLVSVVKSIYRSPLSFPGSHSLKFYLYMYIQLLQVQFVSSLEIFILLNCDYLYFVVTSCVVSYIFVFCKSLYLCSCYYNFLYFARVIVFFSNIAFIQAVLKDSPLLSSSHTSSKNIYKGHLISFFSETSL